MGCHRECCRPCCDNGLNDIACGICSIANGFGKGICCGLNTLGNLGCSLSGPGCCCNRCNRRPCCCRPRPCPHPPTCRCRCECRCE